LLDKRDKSQAQDLSFFFDLTGRFFGRRLG